VPPNGAPARGGVGGGEGDRERGGGRRRPLLGFRPEADGQGIEDQEPGHAERPAAEPHQLPPDRSGDGGVPPRVGQLLAEVRQRQVLAPRRHAEAEVGQDQQPREQAEAHRRQRAPEPAPAGPARAHHEAGVVSASAARSVTAAARSGDGHRSATGQ
jgi:hypothetical protein